MNEQPVSKDILHLVSALLVKLPDPTRQLLVEQVHDALVVNEVPGQVINFAVPSYVMKAQLPDGPVYPIPAVIGDDGELRGELILWLKNGHVIGLEHPWFTDDPPESWPDVAHISFSPG